MRVPVPGTIDWAAAGAAAQPTRARLRTIGTDLVKKRLRQVLIASPPSLSRAKWPNYGSDESEYRACDVGRSKQSVTAVKIGTGKLRQIGSVGPEWLLFCA